MILRFGSDKATNGCASGGHYYHVGKYGYKVLGDGDIEDELKALKWFHAKVPGVFPRPVGIVTVYEDGVRERALKMEHIFGKTLSYDNVTAAHKKTFEDIQKKLARLDCWLSDHGTTHNSVVDPSGRLRLVDADPQYIEFPAGVIE